MATSIKLRLLFVINLLFVAIAPSAYSSGGSATLSNKASDLAQLVLETPLDISIVNIELGGKNNVQLNLTRYQPFLENSVVIIGSDDGRVKNEKPAGTVYYRGGVQGETDSIAFLAISEVDGEINGSVRINETHWQISLDNRAQKLVSFIPSAKAGSIQPSLLDDVIEFDPLDHPQSRSIEVDWTNTTAAGQSLSPAISGTVDGINETQLGNLSVTGYSSAVSLSSPLPGGNAVVFSANIPQGASGAFRIFDLGESGGNADLYVRRGDPAVYECERATPDSSDEECIGIESGDVEVVVVVPDPTESVAFGIQFILNAVPLGDGFLYEVPIAVDIDYPLFAAFGEDQQAVETYFAELFATANHVYELEARSRLKISAIRIRTSATDDPYTDITMSSVCRLAELGNKWLNNSELQSIQYAKVAHFTDINRVMGGVAFLESLCSAPRAMGAQSVENCPIDLEVYGPFSVNGIYGPSDSQQANSWDDIVFTHETGHVFSSPHSHCYGGIGGDSNPVDACYNGDPSPYEGCWRGEQTLPGLNSLVGGSVGGENGTIMSYCHLLQGGVSNVSMTFGKEHPYGIQPDRVSNKMASYVANTAVNFPSCINIVESDDGSQPLDTDGDGIPDAVDIDINADGVIDLLNVIADVTITKEQMPENGAPLQLNAPLFIENGATLRVEPGVKITGGYFINGGSLVFSGTLQDRVELRDVVILGGDATEGKSTLTELNFVHMVGGDFFGSAYPDSANVPEVSSCGPNKGSTGLTVRDSILEGLGFSYLRCSLEDIYLERNSLIGWSDKMTVALLHSDQAFNFIFKNNFVDGVVLDFQLQNPDNNASVLLRNNSFMTTGSSPHITVGKGTDVTGKFIINERIDAKENFWGTTEKASIEDRLEDRRKDPDRYATVQYEPVLITHHPDTPVDFIPDRDGDGITDSEDAFPDNPSESLDSDSDGIGDNSDAFPNDPGEWKDSDSDGIGNNADSDDDNDGIEDTNDQFPEDPSESVDSDGDGIGDNADPDDDNDGVPDTKDPRPYDAREPEAVTACPTGASNCRNQLP